MRISLRLMSMAFTAFLSVPGFSYAQGNAHRCNGCTAEQYIETAMAEQQPGVEFVYDFANGNIRKFEVARKSNGNRFTYHADPLEVTEAEQTYFDMSAAAWSRNDSSLRAVAYMDVTQTFPGSGVLQPEASAYDVARFPSMQNNLTDWLQTYSGEDFTQAIQALVAVIRQSSADVTYEPKDLAQLTLVLELATLHTIVVVWEKGAVPLITKLVDGNNNTIPFPLSTAVGQGFEIGGGDGQDGSRLSGFVGVLGGAYDNKCGRSTVTCGAVGETVHCGAYPPCP